MTAAPARPRDVVFAGVLTILGSVLALMGIFTAQGELRSSQVRREIEAVLAEQQLGALDLTVDTVLDIVEYALMAASAASVAAIVLAVYVMRRHNPSRIALTVLGGLAAVLLLLQWPTGVVIAFFVAYTVSLLWRAPVRQWFAQGAGADGTPDGGPARPAEPGGDAGQQWPTDPAQPGGAPSRPTGPWDHPEAQPGDREQPGAYPQPWPPDPQAPGQQAPGQQAPGQQAPGQQAPGQQVPGQQVPGQQWPPSTPQQDPHRPQPAPATGPAYPSDPGYGAPAYPQPYGYGYPPGYGYGYPPAPGDPHRRPAPLVAAHVLTWVGVAFGLIVGVFFLAAAGSQQVIDLVMEQLAAEDLTEQEFAGMLRFAGAITALWTLAVAVVSIFSWRRANWAAILLTVMGAGYLLVQLFTLVTGQLAVLFTIVWVSAVLVLLWWPTSRQWYAGAKRGGPYGPTAGGPPYQSPPNEPPQAPSPPKRNQPW